MTAPSAQAITAIGLVGAFEASIDVLDAVLSDPVDVGDGYPLPYDWSAVPGADGVEVTAARLVLVSSPAEERQELPVSQDGNGLIISVPSNVDTRALTLAGLYRADGDTRVTIRSQGDLNLSADDPDQHGRLLVTVESRPGAGFGPPSFAVPQVDGQGAIPPSLTGARLDFGPQPALRLPDGVRASRLRLSLVTGQTMDQFIEPQRLGVDRVRAVLVRPPRDLTVTGPDNTLAQNVPGEQPKGLRHELDLVPSAQKALSAALTAGQPLRGAFSLRGAAGSTVRVGFGGVTGALTRSVKGVHTTLVSGEPTVPVGFESLPAETPGEVRGDLTIRYQGLRVLAELSDPVPTRQGGLAGQVLVPGGSGMARALPPAGLGAYPLAMVGLIGRAAEDCALTLTPVRVSGGPAGPAAQAQLLAARRIGLTWLTFATPLPVSEPVTLIVTVTRGRYHWVADPLPLARLVVADPAPPAMPVLLGGTQLSTVDAGGRHLPGHQLPAAAFTVSAAALSSDLFVQVDLSDVVMRYPR